jgi:hypothetical protein
MAEGKHLGAELGVGAGADQHKVNDEEDELVGEAEKHDGGTRPAAATTRGAGRWPSSKVDPGLASEVALPN